MDKSWIDLESRTLVYLRGIDAFLDYAYRDKPKDISISCPCEKCDNRYFKSHIDVRDDCFFNGFSKNYKNWTYHGESYTPIQRPIPTAESSSFQNITENEDDDIAEFLYDEMRVPQLSNNEMNDGESSDNDELSGANTETLEIYQMLKDSKLGLYTGCTEFTKLSFITQLLSLKVASGWTNKSFTLLLNLLEKAFPPGVRLPKDFNEANKITKKLGCTYETWDVCPNNCMLFRNQDQKLEACEICGASRYKEGDKKIAVKKMRYFPLKPRLQKLFMLSDTSSLMRWHAEERINDGKYRHPADSLAWKDFDQKHIQFSSDNRNVRLGLAADGFSPFKLMNTSHSTWPIMLIPYNLPPWLCMKKENIILSTLIDGPKSPGNKIDVYLQPLIEELNELFDVGVETFDISKNEMFNLKAALLWTISDYPGNSILSGWGTMTDKGCCNCGMSTMSRRLEFSHKYSYTFHRRFLKRNHRFRKDTLSFDGTMEWGAAPKRLTGQEVLDQLNLKGILTEYKKEDLKRRLCGDYNEEDHRYWKKRSIFFELSYWKSNLIRHNLDAMHIEKNVCDNIIFTLLNVKGKTKDNLNARRELAKLGVRKPLHPFKKPSGRWCLPPGPCNMGLHEKDIFCKTLKSIKAPDGFASNISKCVHVEKRNIWGLKSHDNHVLMQQLLTVAVRNALPKNVVEVLIELSTFFKILCSKVCDVSELEKIQDRIALTLCHLERIFPPSFFDIMEHLPMHLAEEAIIGGSNQYRWMYPIERFLMTLKIYMRNKAYPEASIANGYILEECMSFCSRYLRGVETRASKTPRNHDGGNVNGRLVGKGKEFHLDHVTWVQAHRYVLQNTDVVKIYREKHINQLKIELPRANAKRIESLHHESFHTWFKKHEVARRNASNIAQYKFHHRLGRKPILELEKEFLAKGKVPSKIDIFVTSRAPNGKPPVNDHTIGRINSLIDKATQVSDGERTRESDDIVWIEEMGVDGHGRVKAAGQGVKPSKHRHSWTSSLNDAIKEKIREEVSEELKEEMREEREQMKREFELMREEREQMREFMNQMTQNMAHAQAVASHTRNEMTQTVVEEVVSYFGLGQFPISPFISSTAPLRSATAPLRGPAAPSKQFAPLRPATAPLRGPAAPSKQFAPSSSFNMRQVQGGVSTHGAAHIAPLKPFPSSFRPFDMRQVHDRASTYGASASETSSEI